MNTKWKKEIHNEISSHSGYDPNALENFISTEIIEKLIEDIGFDDHEQFDDGCKTDVFEASLKQQLRDKWL